MSTVLSVTLLGCALQATDPTYPPVTIRVPLDVPTIQSALDIAPNRGVILVSPGVYPERIVFRGMGVWLRSTDGPASTVIDGGGLGTVATFNRGEGADAILEGFTITGGRSESGGGIFCEASSPTIRGNLITGNSATHPSFVCSGGGVLSIGGSPTIHGNEIRGNGATSRGGGISCNGGRPRITGNVIAGNRANAGGGVAVACEHATVQGNLMEDNEAFTTWYGHTWLPGAAGGLATTISAGLVSSARVEGNVIRRNRSEGFAGGIQITGCTAELANNTVVANSAQMYGGGLVVRYQSTVTVANTILWDDVAPVGAEIWIGDQDWPCQVTTHHCDVEGGEAGVFVSVGSTVGWGPGNLEIDPAFIDVGTGSDLHLLYASPCRDAGDAAAAQVTDDFEGDPRIVGQTIDIGADEFHRHLYYTGLAVPGSTVQVKLIGLPDSRPVAIFLASAVRESPLPSPWGPLLLQSPIVTLAVLPPMSASGLSVLPLTLPPNLPSPYELPMQAMIGPMLSNVSLLSVR